MSTRPGSPGSGLKSQWPRPSGRSRWGTGMNGVPFSGLLVFIIGSCPGRPTPLVLPSLPEHHRQGGERPILTLAVSCNESPPPCGGGLSAGGACPDKPVGKGPGVGLHGAPASEQPSHPNELTVVSRHAAQSPLQSLSDHRRRIEGCNGASVRSCHPGPGTCPSETKNIRGRSPAPP